MLLFLMLHDLILTPKALLLSDCLVVKNKIKRVNLSQHTVVIFMGDTLSATFHTTSKIEAKALFQAIYQWLNE